MYIVEMKHEAERDSTYTLTCDLLIHCLYFICKCKFYARTHGKIKRQWKSTLTLITIVSALILLFIKKYFVYKVSNVVLEDGI